MTFEEEKTIEYAVREIEQTIVELMRQITVLRERSNNLDKMKAYLKQLLPEGKPVEHIEQ